MARRRKREKDAEAREALQLANENGTAYNSIVVNKPQA